MGLVQSKQGHSTSSPLAITLDSATTAGNGLIVLVGSTGSTNDGTVSGITLGGAAGNFASVASSGNPAADAAVMDCWLDLNCAGGQTAISISFTGASGTIDFYAAVYERDDLLSASAFDKSSGNPVNGSASSWTSNATATTTQATEVWAGGVLLVGASALTATGPSSPWANLTALSNVNGSVQTAWVSGWEAVTSTGTATYSGTVSPAASVGYTALAVTLKASAPAAAVLPARPGRTWLRQFHHRQQLPPAPAPAAVSPAVPAPLVAQAAATPGFGQPAVPVTARSSLQDFATPVAPVPLVVTPVRVPQVPAAPVTSRNSLADAPVLTTPAPAIIQAAAAPGWGRPQAPVISAAPFIAATPAATAPAPLVVTSATPPPLAGFPVTSRNSLADPPVLTTPAPQVIPAAATPGHGRPGPAVISGAPFIPVAAPTQATPPPVVAWTQPPAVPPQQALTSRNSLADAPALTTPAPVVVMATAVTPHGRPQAAVITASPAAPATAAAVTPQPVIVAQAVKLAAAQPPVILRNTLADPPVLTTPRPVVVMTQVRPPPTITVISGAPFIPPPPPVVFALADPGGTALTQATPSGQAVTAATGGGSTVTATPGGTAMTQATPSSTAATTATPGGRP